MQQIFLDFLEESFDSPRRKQEGIYEFYDIDFGIVFKAKKLSQKNNFYD